MGYHMWYNHMWYEYDMTPECVRVHRSVYGSVWTSCSSLLVFRQWENLLQQCLWKQQGTEKWSVIGTQIHSFKRNVPEMIQILCIFFSWILSNWGMFFALLDAVLRGETNWESNYCAGRWVYVCVFIVAVCVLQLLTVCFYLVCGLVLCLCVFRERLWEC